MAAVITAANMRRLEQAAVDRGLSYDALMERAGAAATAVLRDRYIDNAPSPRVLILCGSGNNGGDGYVIARLLAQQVPHADIVVAQTAAPASSLAIAKAALLPDSVTVVDAQTVYDCDAAYTVVVDAVYGIGFHGALSPELRKLFAWVDTVAPVVAIDIPSGINADTGATDIDCIVAAVTVTFTALKYAAILHSRALFGETIVADVGIDAQLTQAYTTEVKLITQEEVYAALPARPCDGHKGTFGRVLSICGSYGMVGAALLAAKAALRAGAGVLHAALPRSVYPIAAGALWEAVYHPLLETEEGTFGMCSLPQLVQLAQDKQAVLVGCGLSRHPEIAGMLFEFLPTLTAPTVIDADGLNALASHIHVVKAMQAPCVLTPHPAEAARLLGITTAEVESDRVCAVRRLAEITDKTVVLKGHRTVIAAPDSAVYINGNGNSGMATGGSGDVLSGIIAAFLARGMSPLDAAKCAVFLHGAAGDDAADRLSETALMPTDLIEELAHVLSHFETRE